MASLTAGSNNFPARVYENPPDLVDWLAAEMPAHAITPDIEAVDPGHLHQAAAMARDGRLKGPLHAQCVMGVKNAMPADRDVFDGHIRTVQRLLPGAEWCAAGIGVPQIVLNQWCVAAGGHARTRLDDNLRLDRLRLASSSAALVQRVADLCHQHSRPVATVTEARAILALAATVPAS